MAVTDDPSRLETARLTLARGTRITDPELSRSLHQVTRVAAATLDVARVGVWFINAAWTEIHCELLYDRRSEQFSTGASLRLADYPRYADALKERRVISAEDAVQDPRTSELAPGYLIPLQIGALLDCPVYENGEVVAIVCHEHVGPRRTFAKRDADFAVSVAELLSTIVAQSGRLKHEAELRKAREELAQARVMESLGRMAAETAHDFNNILMGVSLAIHNVGEEAGDEKARALTDARELLDQGARLVRQLLTFARQGTFNGEPTDASAKLLSMLPRIERILGQDVTLTHEVAANAGKVRLDPAVFEQVVTNLVVNARDAMPGGGALQLRLEREQARLKLRVQDTGIGMSEATKQRIFEPFFSTKGQRGTGLGLAIVFGAVQSAGGSIGVESEPGRGCVFTLDFPIQL